MKPTEVATLANGIRNANESLTIPRIAKAASAFQNLEGNAGGTSQSRRNNRQKLARHTTPTST